MRVDFTLEFDAISWLLSSSNSSNILLSHATENPATAIETMSAGDCVISAFLILAGVCHMARW
jgi:hypothetical protein